MEITLAQLNEAGKSVFPGLVGVEIDDVADGVVHARLALRDEHMAPNGYLHAAAVIELKTNFIGSAQTGTITCEARLVHGGRTTQLWDATVSAPDGRQMALFRCTQLVLRG